jgi:hypothetical protein
MGKEFYEYVANRFGAIEKLPQMVREFLIMCSSSVFLRYLLSMTGEDSLIPDPYFIGGGIHSTFGSGFLKSHADLYWDLRICSYS